MDTAKDWWIYRGPGTVGERRARLDEHRPPWREFKGEPGAVVSTERSLAAMTSLAEGIQGLVKNMRSEQQMLRDWIEAQQEESKSLRRTLDRLSERIDSDTKSSGRIRHDNGSE